jgi:hypothetical protein
MSAASLLARARAHGLTLSVETDLLRGPVLRVAGVGQLPSEFLALMRAHRVELIEHLREQVVIDRMLASAAGASPPNWRMTQQRSPSAVISRDQRQSVRKVYLPNPEGHLV